MGVYAVTGSASGMGAEVVARLRADGHTVIGVDLRDAEVIADLSDMHGRAAAVREVLDACGGKLDGAVLAAGIGPSPSPGVVRRIIEINYFGVVDLLNGWHAALAAGGGDKDGGGAKVVVFSSNSTTATPMVPNRAVRAMLAGSADKAERALRIYGSKGAPPLAYAASKIAVSRWVRRTAVTPQWAGKGIRLNALAPGAILTPLLEKQLATPAEAKQINSFPVPTGGFGDPGHLADWVLFMLSDAAEFLCGSIIFVDGGSDAHLRPDDWPRTVGLRGLPGWARRFFGDKAGK